ncbi:TetR/AcrR family transcriptional regulator [Fodinicola acaciae]|uniref:TetR/AcrR family transcriptional regulator n=1 Tax=Fodinicola acaciae TaxID=2681555 RepID=UPI0013D315EA|nr:WHG domain-containing protein [Fodinicola acaciae]
MPDRKQEIIDAALEIAGRDGVPAVSMRAVAEKIGVTPMALYPHIGNKDGLLDAMIGRLLGSLPRPDADASWQDRLAAIAHGVRDLAHRHPGCLELIFARPAVTPDAIRFVDAVFAALLDAGVPPAEVARVERLTSTAIIGFAMSEVNGRFAATREPPSKRAAWATAAELPAHHALKPHLDRKVDWDAEFEADLADLAAMIEAVARRAVR